MGNVSILSLESWNVWLFTPQAGVIHAYERCYKAFKKVKNCNLKLIGIMSQTDSTKILSVNAFENTPSDLIVCLTLYLRLRLWYLDKKTVKADHLFVIRWVNLNMKSLKINVFDHI